MKICTWCKEDKHLLEFPKRKTTKDGLYPWCKECCRKKTKDYVLKNPEKVKETSEKRKDKHLEAARIYKKLHKESLAKKQKIYYEINAEALKEKARAYSKNCTEDQKKARREYYLKWKESDSGREYLKNIAKERRIKYRKQFKASQKVTDAVRSGKLIRPENCSLCGMIGKIEGHHADYSKPLEVIWVCRKCHMAIHRM